ncbi:hypothetical protein S7711_11211 [Stachybotrys chartarum IBT 7711]|uniref:Uncharacterized protein n=1 Tax=Stachybotrys chartarum (strain CBS 109288 / IBT 7711) TaxID=1280523 RepID=A0A084AHK1_STACB|nr:hypothetical protein S7711_11211 [Stachybotrys chartarum IBT 7711]KFA74856.1 hypothetical protein S40288_10807 [Stachybotrys chartarum IBT 40288]
MLPGTHRPRRQDVVYLGMTHSHHQLPRNPVCSGMILLGTGLGKSAGRPWKLEPSFYIRNDDDDDDYHHHDNSASDRQRQASMAFDYIVVDFFRPNPS